MFDKKQDQEVITYQSATVNGVNLFEDEPVIFKTKNKDGSFKIESFNGVILGEHKKSEKPVIFSGEPI